jgi:hypothetical protein
VKLYVKAFYSFVILLLFLLSQRYKKKKSYLDLKTYLLPFMFTHTSPLTRTQLKGFDFSQDVLAILSYYYATIHLAAIILLNMMMPSFRHSIFFNIILR